MRRYNPKEIEPKWQITWDKNQTYKANFQSSKPKYMAMSMFNYPSGAGIHIGHAMNYTISDVMARLKRQQGFESYHPVGWDAFGLPAENYAIKAGVSPQASMATIISSYRKQYKAMGWSNDWSKEISTHLPEYYKWTQWIFSEMYKNGLAYQASRLQWWCDKCQTVLANEQVDAHGKCWRHDGPNDPIVEKKEVKQWFFKITDYADELLDAIDDLDWTESVKLAQKNWIGKSQGAEIDFQLEKNSSEAISYVMGVDDISQELEKIGVKIIDRTDRKSFKVSFPYEKTVEFEELIARKLKPGFWNEYITNKAVFIFKDKAGKTKRIIWDESDESELLQLCNEYAKADFPSIRQMLEGNDWYSGKIDSSIKVFTTRPDTIYGATYMVLAPEHELVPKLTLPQNKAAIETYQKEVFKKTDVQRQTASDKTGVFTGSYAINPVNDEKIPIWIADYVLMGYGTGAIMAVPAHDQRDHDFAKKFDLEVRPVVAQVFGKELPDVKDVEGVVVIGYDPRTKKFLGLKRNSGKSGSEHWLIGGGKEDGETFKKSAERELAEEAGFKDFDELVQLGDPVYSYYHNPIKNVNRRSLGVNFLAIIDTNKAGKTHQESHEDFELNWTDFAEIYDGIEKTNKDFGADHWLDALNKARVATDQIYKDKKYTPEIYEGEGIMINSGKYDGMSSSDAREKIVKDLAGMDFENEAKVEYIKNPKTGEEELVFTDIGEGAPKPDQPFEEREAVEVLVKHWSQDKYIGLKWKKINWETIITGGIEEGQTAEESAIAEIRQETGYQNPVLKKKFGMSHAKFYHAPKKVNRFAHFRVLYFELANGEKKEISDEEKEIHEVVWLDKQEMDKFRLPDSQRYMWNLYLGRAGAAREKTTYRLRDWSVSRQRYWGAPIPIINCQKCGQVLVEDKDLPVILPELEDFQPSGDGRSALARAADWLKVSCPKCGSEGKRETDTLDTYICSSWYMLRYLDPKNSAKIFDSLVVNKWMPVDFYNGGDHATAHMIYARFVTRFFHKLGLVDNPEPFKKFLFNGKVTAADGKMFGKSKGNSVDPLDIVNSGYGADALRTYLMFAAPLELWVRWDPQGVPGTYRFLNRVWNIIQEFIDAKKIAGQNAEVLKIAHQTIKKVTEDLEHQKYNTAIAAMMKCTNELYNQKAKEGFSGTQSWQFALTSLVQLVAPFAPHIAEELWQNLGYRDSVHIGHWPVLDEKYLTVDIVTLAVQVNGKLRGEISLPADANEEVIIKTAKEKVASTVAGRQIKKTVYIPGRLVNLVTN